MLGKHWLLVCRGGVPSHENGSATLFNVGSELCILVLNYEPYDRASLISYREILWFSGRPKLGLGGCMKAQMLLGPSAFFNALAENLFFRWSHGRNQSFELPFTCLID